MNRREISENEIVEVAGWRKQQRRKKPKGERASQRQRRAWVSMAVGLGCALLWHFGHLAGEVYSPALDDPHLWFHLALEGIIALYAAALCFIIWNLARGE